MTEVKGRRDGVGRRVCVIVSQFNVMVTERLLEGALESLAEDGVSPADIDVLRVPGAWEIAPAASRAVGRGYDAIVALGAVVRGETAHFDYLCRTVTDGLSRLQERTGIPVGFGIITADNLSQALERSGGQVGNLGQQAARAALEMADLFRRLDDG